MSSGASLNTEKLNKEITTETFLVFCFFKLVKLKRVENVAENLSQLQSRFRENQI